MQYSPHIPTVRIHLDRIRRNYKRMEDQAAGAAGSPGTAMLPFSACMRGPSPAGCETVPFAWPAVMPVVKADAYGHGHIAVSAALAEEGARLFASGSVEEAAQLRQGLHERLEKLGHSPEAPLPVVLSLLGVVSGSDARLAAEGGIITMLHTFEQLGSLQSASGLLPVAVKCNTGMARLGFALDDLPELIARLAGMPHVQPVLAISHLASADSEQGPEEVRRQGALFSRMLRVLREAWPGIAASLGNSAGTLLCAEVAKEIGPHLCRPGITLYGGNPFAGTSHEHLGAALEQAMDVSTPVIALRSLPAGTGIGYGHTFVAPKDMRVAIIAAGYADCLTRGMSNKGLVCIRGSRAPVVGRVSMQMTAVDVSGVPDVAVGDEAWLLGGPFASAVTAAELAGLWGTITYEVFCLLGYNTRVYTE